MTKAGGGSGGVVRPFNEYMLVVSLALRKAENARALAVKHLWFGSDQILKKSYGSHATLTTRPPCIDSFVGARHALLQWRLSPQSRVGSVFRAATAGGQALFVFVVGPVIPLRFDGGGCSRRLQRRSDWRSPRHGFFARSSGGMGRLATLHRFYTQQAPASDPRYRYGMVRVSAERPGWIPTDTALVDHMFLLFGLMESLHPTFFTDRMTPRLAPGNIIADGHSINVAAAADRKPAVGLANEVAADDGTTNVADTANQGVSRRSMLASIGILAGVPASAARAFLFSLLSSMFLIRGRRLPG